MEEKKKVAIVGFAGTRDMAPYKDESFEIWSVNNLYSFIPRTDRIFELHPKELLEHREHHGAPGGEHLSALKQMGIPIYMQEKYEDIPSSVEYPLQAMIECFGIPRMDGKQKDAYFTNSISFMTALAITEGFKVIHLYGVDMAVNTEYNEQRPSCEYYIGIAKGMGIDIRIPVASDLLKTRFIYGYEEAKVQAWELKCRKTIEEMAKRKLQSDQRVAEQSAVSQKYEGAIQAVKEMERTWG